MRRKTVWSVLIVVMAVTLVLSSHMVLSAEKGKKYGGSLNVMTVYGIEPSTFDFWDGSWTTEHGVLNMISETLLMGSWKKSLGGTGEYTFNLGAGSWMGDLAPALAEKWEQPNPLTVIFHLRKGVYWHNKPPVNGREFVAEDVKLYYERFMKSPKTNKVFTGFIESVEATDKYTVVFKFTKPRDGVVKGMTTGSSNGWILPHEIWEKDRNTKDWRNLVGTGPFILENYVPGNHFSFKKNPNYWGYDELNPGNKLPYVDNVTTYIIPNKATQLAALRTGKIDMLSGINWEDMGSLNKSNPKLKKVKHVAGSPSMAVFFRTDKKPFSDVRVRRALQMAVDRQLMIDEYFHGEGLLINWPVRPFEAEHMTPAAELPPKAKELFEFNPEKARKLLAEAGYPKGFKAELVTSAIGEYVDYSSLLQAWWADIGVEIKIKVVEETTRATMQFNKTYNQLMAGGIGSTAAYNDLFSYFATGERLNFSLFSDPWYDEQIKKALYEITDKVERDKLYKKLNTYSVEQAVYLTLPSAYNYTYWWPWLANYTGEHKLGRAAGGALWARIWIDGDMKKAMGH